MRGFFYDVHVLNVDSVTHQFCTQSWLTQNARDSSPSPRGGLMCGGETRHSLVGVYIELIREQ